LDPEDRWRYPGGRRGPLPPGASGYLARRQGWSGAAAAGERPVQPDRDRRAPWGDRPSHGARGLARDCRGAAGGGRNIR